MASELRTLTKDEINALEPKSIPSALPVYTYPLVQTRSCWSEACSTGEVENTSNYSYSRIHPWVKGPGYMDRYRASDAATKVHRDCFWDFYACSRCGAETGYGPNNINQVSEESKAARTWKEPSDEQL
jgi:hypothetical protein